MRGLIEVFRFECRHQLKSPLFLLIAALYGAIPFLLVASAPDLGATKLNSPIEILSMAGLLGGVILMFPAVALIATALTRDYELKTAEQFFASGIGERAFALGRFAGSITPVIGVGVCILFGHWIGILMPWVDAELLGPVSFAPYAYAFAVFTLPNALMLGVLFGAVGALTRSLAACYVAAIVLFLAYMIAGSILPAEPAWPTYFDPFGGGALARETRFWTAAELNAEIPGGLLLANRAVWSSVGLAALGLLVWRFRFNPNPPAFRLWRRKQPGVSSVPAAAGVVARASHSAAGCFAQVRSQLRMDLRAVVTSLPFHAILTLTTLFTVLIVLFGIQQGAGTQLLPRTGLLTAQVAGILQLFLAVMVVYLSAELVHRERQSGVAALVDASPFPNGVGIASKILSLWFVAAAVMLMAMATTTVMQIIWGFTEFELGLSAAQLVGGAGLWILLLGVVAVFVQVLVPNKWAGMLIMIGIILWDNVSIEIGLEHYLARFWLPPLTHSDMNGYGHYGLPLLAFTAYWAAFVVVLAVAAHLFYRRGLVDRFRQRLSEARARLTRGPALTAVAGIVAFAAIGTWIFYNTNVLNDYESAETVRARQADYERRYKSLENTNRVEYAAVELEVELFPEERRLESRGRAVLVNVEPGPVEETLIEVSTDIAEAGIVLPRGELVGHDETHGVHRFRFDPPLDPGESFEMSWELIWLNPGFPSSGHNDSIAANGTFVDNDEVMPSLGYNRGRELADRTERRKHDLPARERVPPLGDPAWTDIALLGSGQRTAFRATIGTAADQVAVAPGYLEREWLEGERRYFTYVMDAPIWPFFSFSSARYDVARDDWNGVAIEIYHDAKHPYNIERMIESTKQSLEYFTREFSPYQYRQYRVLEFPRYRAFAQSFPNTIPYSEAIGFIADQRDPSDVDYPFYVTAHELAHQWWGHQIAGAATQGVSVLSESLAQYSALMVMEDYYGEAMMRRFLKYELDGYLVGRRGEAIEELPLMYSENQGYIHYQKGSLVMYALKDLIGEDRVNQALRAFLDRYAFTGPPFPTARDLVDAFRAVAGPEHQDAITDWFEKIVLYELAVESVSSVPVDGGYELTIDVSARKFEADGGGVETEAPLSAWLDVAVFPAPAGRLGESDLPPPLYLEKHLIASGEQRIVVRVDSKPDRVGLDPYNKMIDRNPENNLLRL